MKTSELTGAALDWAVATCEKWRLDLVPEGSYTPSTDWAQGGPIIEREKISAQECDGVWSASVKMPDGSWPRWGYGPTYLIAAMRCYVASKLGDTIDVPSELV